MPEVTERSLQLRNKNVKECEAGKGFHVVKRPCNFCAVCNREVERGADTSKPRVGAPRKMIRPITKLKNSVKKYPETSIEELVEEMVSIGVNVTRKKVTTKRRTPQAPSEEDSSSKEETPLRS